MNMAIKMSPTWLSAYEAQIFRAISMFPKEHEGKFISIDELRKHFKGFHGRPGQDVLEALQLCKNRGYLDYKILLAPDYLEQGEALGQLTAALHALQPESDTPPAVHHGLSKLILAKVVANRPLTKAEASGLPDEAKRYLGFMLSDIDREQLRQDLAVYEDSTFIAPSRLVKSIESVTPMAAVNETATLPPLDISAISLTPESYSKNTGVLHLAPYHDRIIAGKVGIKRPNGQKYDQCRIMECVFKSNKTLRHGVEISSILGISKNIVDKTTTKKIENAKAAINGKVANGGGPKNLIKIQNGKVFLNNSYL